MHDSSQSSNPTYTNTSLLQPGNGKVIQVQGSTPKTGQTTLTFSKAVTSFLTDRQLKIYNLSGAHDGYLNCGDANHCLRVVQRNGNGRTGELWAGDGSVRDAEGSAG